MSKNKPTNLSRRTTNRLHGLPRKLIPAKVATLLVAFLLSFAVSVIVNPVFNSSAIECSDGVTSSGGVCGTDNADVHVSVEGGWAISVSSAGTLGVDVSPTRSGMLSTVVDNVNVYTNIPTGYQLYLNSTSGSTSIYNSSDTEQSQNHFVETSGTKAMPAELAGDTWGYSLDATPTTFAKVALANDDPDSNIYTANTKTPSEGDDIPVTYGFMTDTKLQPGAYSTSVTYTVIADAPAYTITSVSPSTLQQDDQTNKTIIIMTSTPATELAFGEVSAKIGTVDLTDCSEITSDGYRGVTCTYSGSLTPGYYNVELTSTWHNAKYSKANGFAIMSYLTVSGGSGSGWYAPGTVVPIVASACSTGYTFSNWTTTGGTIANANASSTTITTNTSNITVTRNCKVSFSCSALATNGTGTYNGYAVKKLADGKCWQTSNLRSNVSWTRRGSCPEGFNFPTKYDFDTLKGKYSGGGLYSAWGTSTVFWSSTGSGTDGWYLGVSTARADVIHGSLTDMANVRCYTTN